MVDSTGNVVAKYKYDLWGVQTKESGTKDAEFGYGGYYVHRPSGLYLTWYRQYDPSIARWLSRDPIGEQGGLNLYRYVGNSPVGYFDPTGLARESSNCKCVCDWAVLKKEWDTIANLIGGSIQGKYAQISPIKTKWDEVIKLIKSLGYTEFDYPDLHYSHWGGDDYKRPNPDECGGWFHITVGRPIRNGRFSILPMGSPPWITLHLDCIKPDTWEHVRDEWWPKSWVKIAFDSIGFGRN